MPAAASGGACPSFTNANEKTSTHDDREEQRRRQDLAALHLDRDVLPQHEERGPQEHASRSVAADAAPRYARPIALTQPARRRLVGEQPAVAHDRHARDQAVGQIEIVRREDDDGAVGGELPQPVGDDADRLDRRGR